MKRILSAVLSVLMIAACFAGCGKENARVLYKDKLTKYVTLGDYKGIKVDTKSDEFKKYYTEVISYDVSSNGLYVHKNEGKAANGDTVNIDYVGKKDGVAFEGGTANGYDLELGSNSFIDGFEAGLVGKEIGSTVDLNLTFPKDYKSTELAGKAVVFTVKINYVLTDEERKPEDYYKELEFDTLDKYTADVTERAAKSYLVDKVKEDSDIKKYPEQDTESIYAAYKNMIEQNIKNQMGATLSDYLAYNNQTEEDFKKELIKEQINPMMDEQMVLYSVLDKEKLSVTETDVKNKLDETVKSYNNPSITADTLNNYYGEYYFEYLAVSEKAIDFLYKNAKIS